MRSTVSLLALAALAAFVTPSLASFGGGGSSSSGSTPSASSGSIETKSPKTPREEAERLYAQAYEEIARAKQDAADGKAKNSEKRYKRALEWGESAVSRDAAYHEAWNLVGFAARKLSDFDKSVAAYEKCLTLKPDYAPAREYLGEAWLEKGDAKKAREQLVLLERYKADGEAKTLRTAIEAYEKAQGVTEAATSTEAGSSH
ncbi:MAG: tetratricopeptide repeat protein [Candidatus Eisenbacteria bacterium]|uniref:Tetratricopeptide repeat protein n=1 Tax=Eiseniibacteriota bacterium TaxID=2212470 RepID=A0A849SPM5_UNCEI|nr:tetratricopeptide repeat protein [Candidatus Eisenbacteria bacterium]